MQKCSEHLFSPTICKLSPHPHHHPAHPHHHVTTLHPGCDAAAAAAAILDSRAAAAAAAAAAASSGMMHDHSGSIPVTSGMMHDHSGPIPNALTIIKTNSPLDSNVETSAVRDVCFSFYFLFFF